LTDVYAAPSPFDSAADVWRPDVGKHLTDPFYTRPLVPDDRFDEVTLLLFGNGERNGAASAMAYGVLSDLSDSLAEIAGGSFRQSGQRSQEASSLRRRANITLGSERKFGDLNVHGTVTGEKVGRALTCNLAGIGCVGNEEDLRRQSVPLSERMRYSS
jgi:hypothetical protein